MTTKEKILETMNKVTELLIKKNSSYGDSATKPKNIFAKGSAVENISARIDDKLSRINNVGLVPKVYDTIDDLIGYLCLLKIALNEENKEYIKKEKEIYKKRKTKK